METGLDVLNRMNTVLISVAITLLVGLGSYLGLPVHFGDCNEIQVEKTADAEGVEPAAIPGPVPKGGTVLP